MSGALLDHAEVVAEPLHEGAGDGDGALEGVHGRLVADLVAQGGEQAALGRDDLLARVHEHEAAGAVGVLRLAGGEARLAEEGRLLVAQVARDRHAVEIADARAVDLGGGLDLGEHGLRHAHDAQDLVVPVEGLEVHEHGARRVGDVRDMHAAVDAAGEVPDAPGVHVAEHQVAGLGLLAGAGDVVQDPADLGAGEVGGQREADLRPEAVLAALLGELVDEDVGAGVLPDDGVEDRHARLLVPDEGGLALVGDADGGEVGGGDAGLGHGALDDLARAGPDLHRVVLDPARLRVDLLVLLLIDRHDRAGVVEDHEAGARGALVEGADVLAS